MLNHILKKFKFSSVPVIDTSNFINKQGTYMQDCEKVADALHKIGCVIIKDPMVQQ